VAGVAAASRASAAPAPRLGPAAADRHHRATDSVRRGPEGGSSRWACPLEIAEQERRVPALRAGRCVRGVALREVLRLASVERQLASIAARAALAATETWLARRNAVATALPRVSCSREAYLLFASRHTGRRAEGHSRASRPQHAHDDAQVYAPLAERAHGSGRLAQLWAAGGQCREWVWQRSRVHSAVVWLSRHRIRAKLGECIRPRGSSTRTQPFAGKSCEIWRMRPQRSSLRNGTASRPRG